MNLKAYLQENKITQKQFSKKINIHFMHLSKILCGTRRPSADLAEQIEIATGNRVTRLELLYPDKKQVLR